MYVVIVWRMPAAKYQTKPVSEPSNIEITVIVLFISGHNQEKSM
jgi:hypothetical protein